MSSAPSPNLATNPPADPMIGLMIAGRFSITRLIGEGGMGSVYEARQEPLGRKVALKFLKSDVADDQTRERFEREAKILSALQHPNMVTIFDYGSALIQGEQQFYIAMEFVQGQDLDARLRSGPPLEPDALMHLILGVAQGLSEAHRNNITHRDLKPANILLAPLHSNRFGFSPKLLDFGIARFGKSNSHLTQTGMVFGTPAYMAPEQATGSIEIGPHTDIYTFGVILYELLSGARPFTTSAPLQLIFAHANKPPPPLVLKPEYEGKIPSGLLRLVEWCLNKDPLDRPISKPPADCTSDDERARCLVLLLEQAITATHPNFVGAASSGSFNTQAIEAVRFGISSPSVASLAAPSTSPNPAQAASPATAPQPSFAPYTPAPSTPAAPDPDSPATTPARNNPFHAPAPIFAASSAAGAALDPADLLPSSPPQQPLSLAKAPAATPAASIPTTSPPATAAAAEDNASAAEFKHALSLRALPPPSPTRATDKPNRTPLLIAAALLIIILLVWLLSGSKKDTTSTSTTSVSFSTSSTTSTTSTSTTSTSTTTNPAPTPPAEPAAPPAAQPAPEPPTEPAAPPQTPPTPPPADPAAALQGLPEPAPDPTPDPTPPPSTDPIPDPTFDPEFQRLISIPGANTHTKPPPKGPPKGPPHGKGPPKGKDKGKDKGKGGKGKGDRDDDD